MAAVGRGCLETPSFGFTRAADAKTGRPGYHPPVLLKLFIYGYLNRVSASRRLEREADTSKPKPRRKTDKASGSDPTFCSQITLPNVTPGCRSGREAGQATCQRSGAATFLTHQNDIDGLRTRLKPPEAARMSRNGQKIEMTVR